jgi:hypothetical protein
MDIILGNQNFVKENNLIKCKKAIRLYETKSLANDKLKIIGIQFFTISGVSLASYIYLNYFTNFFRDTNSLKIFKPLFIGTFILTPPMLGMYFTYLDNKLFKEFF